MAADISQKFQAWDAADRLTRIAKAFGIDSEFKPDTGRGGPASGHCAYAMMEEGPARTALETALQGEGVRVGHIVRDDRPALSVAERDYHRVTEVLERNAIWHATESKLLGLQS